MPSNTATTLTTISGRKPRQLASRVFPIVTTGDLFLDLGLEMAANEGRASRIRSKAPRPSPVPSSAATAKPSAATMCDYAGRLEAKLAAFRLSRSPARKTLPAPAPVPAPAAASSRPGSSLDIAGRVERRAAIRAKYRFLEPSQPRRQTPVQLPIAPRAGRFQDRSVDVSGLARVLFTAPVKPVENRKLAYKTPVRTPAKAKTVSWADAKGKPLCRTRLVTPHLRPGKLVASKCPPGNAC
ncbi:hypothetical protein MBLNU459_g4672t1 [Dothideomycetes sp. NU459]